MHTQETKDKISQSVKAYRDSIRKPKYCLCCGKIHYHKKKKYCCDKCLKISRMILTLVKYFGFEYESYGSTEVFVEYERIKLKLQHEYWDENLTGRELAERYNYPSYCNITGKIFKYLDIPTRSCKDTNKLGVLNGKIVPPPNVKYKHGWHTSWNGKEVYLRSSYEFSYAEYLDSKCIDYDVESLRIKYFDTQRDSFRCAIPDFYLIDTNTIVEVKSDYTLDRIEMKDKVDAYKSLGYNFKLILNGEEAEL